MSKEEPTSYEIASFAAKFLPPIKLSENWEAEGPTTLSQALEKVSKPGEDGDSSAGAISDSPSWLETLWEVLCGEAVRRANILLAYAAGKVRPEVLEHRKQEGNFPSWLNSKRESEAKWEERFNRVAKGRKTISKLDALKAILPRCGEGACNAYYESKLGRFRNAVCPEVKHFRDFPAWIRKNLAHLKDKPVLSYCTGAVKNCQAFSSTKALPT